MQCIDAIVSDFPWENWENPQAYKKAKYRKLDVIYKIYFHRKK